MNLNKKTIQKTLFVLLILIMATLRFVYLVQSPNNPGFRSFMFPDDQEYYHRMAESVAGGNLLVCEGNITRGPGYIYFLGLLYKLSANNTIFVRIIQFFLGILSGIFLYFIATRMFGIVVGLISCALYTFYLPMICYEGTLLMTSLITFSLTAGFFYFIKALQDKKSNYFYLAGAFYGVAFLCRPNNVLLVLFLLGCLLIKRTGKKTIFKFLSIFLLLYSLIIFRNYLADSDLFNVSDQGKIVLICGHYHDSEGIGWYRSIMENDIIERSENSFLKFAGIIIEDIRTHSSRWIKKQFLKLHAYFFDYEFPQFVDVYLLKEVVPVFRYPIVIFGLISPFCVLGLLLLLGNFRQRNNVMLSGYFIVSVFSVVIFYVIARFRQPVIPIMCLIAGYCLYRLPRLIMKGGWIKRIVIMILLITLLWGTNYRAKWVYFHKIFWHISLYNRALVYMKQGVHDKAETDLKRCMKLNYFASKPALYLGIIYLKKNDIKTAIRYFYQARSRGELSAELFNHLGRSHKFMGEYDKSIRFFRKSLDMDPNQLGILRVLAECYLKIGDEKKAVDVWLFVTKRFPLSSSIHYNLGCYYAKNNNYEQAYKYFLTVKEIDPDFKGISKMLINTKQQIDK